MLFGKIFYMIHRTISVRFLRDTIRPAIIMLIRDIKQNKYHSFNGLAVKYIDEQEEVSDSE